MNTNGIWYAYAQQVLQQAVPAFDPARQSFSLAASTFALDLGNADYAIVNDAVNRLGNVIPANGPQYAASSAVLPSYRQFLDAIVLSAGSDPNMNSQINLAAASMTAARQNFDSVQTAAVTAWRAFRAINPTIGFYDYATQQYSVYFQVRNALEASTVRWQQLMMMTYGQGYEVVAAARSRLSEQGGASDITMQNAYNMPVATASAASAEAVPALAGLVPPAAPGALFRVQAPSFALQSFSAAYQQWQASAASGSAPAASIHLSGSDAASNWSSMGWSGAGAAIAAAFLGSLVRGSPGGGPGFALSDAFDLRVAFTGFSSFDITPGPWFDAALLQTYRNALQPGSPAFFASSGPLARLPAQIVLGFGATIALKLSAGDYAMFKFAFESADDAAFAIGPFVVGQADTSLYATKSAVTFDDAAASVTVAPPADTVPMLLGVVSTRLDV